MNDSIIFNNYLLLLKSTVEVYVHGTLESSNIDIESLLKENLNKTLEMQKMTYQEMVDNNWYKIENIKTNAIEKVINKINKQ